MEGVAAGFPPRPPPPPPWAPPPPPPPPQPPYLPHSPPFGAPGTAGLPSLTITALPKEQGCTVSCDRTGAFIFVSLFFFFMVLFLYSCLSSPVWGNKSMWLTHLSRLSEAEDITQRNKEYEQKEPEAVKSQLKSARQLLQREAHILERHTLRKFEQTHAKAATSIQRRWRALHAVHLLAHAAQKDRRLAEYEMYETSRRKGVADQLAVDEKLRAASRRLREVTI